MKTLFIGGIKSGKSKNAQEFVLKNSKTKPIYLATNEFFDDEMRARVNCHKKERGENFITVEEPLNLYEAVTKQRDGVVLVECVSMWINNMLHHGFTKKDILDELTKLLTLQMELVFVINDVGSNIIADNPLVREFVDINGIASQLIASCCDEVFHTIAGISVKIK